MSETIKNLIRLARQVADSTGFACDLLGAVEPEKVRPLWHPLGFVHMRLREEDGRALRLHLWSEDFAEPMEPSWPVHNHIFALESLVVAGVIRDSRYDVQSSDNGNRLLYEVLYDEAGSYRRRTEKLVSCVLKEDTIHSVGTTYKIDPGIFHASELGSGRAAVTLVVTNGSGGRPSVVGTLDGAERYAFIKREVDQDVLELIMIELNKLPTFKPHDRV
jgi:hypothetical protein